MFGGIIYENKTELFAGIMFTYDTVDRQRMHHVAGGGFNHVSNGDTSACWDFDSIGVGYTNSNGYTDSDVYDDTWSGTAGNT